MSAAKVKFLLGYNMKIIVVGLQNFGGGIKNLVEKGVTFPTRVWANFWLVGEPPSHGLF